MLRMTREKMDLSDDAELSHIHFQVAITSTFSTKNIENDRIKTVKQSLSFVYFISDHVIIAHFRYYPKRNKLSIIVSKTISHAIAKITARCAQYIIIII